MSPLIDVYFIEAEVRLCVLNSLDSTFDTMLAQPDNFEALNFAMNDENYEIRETAISILGRVSHINPAYIHPLLRTVLLRVSRCPILKLILSNVSQSSDFTCIPIQWTWTNP